MDNSSTKNICLDCDIFKHKIHELLTQCDSVYDAVIDIHYFIIECEKNCQTANKLKEE